MISDESVELVCFIHSCNVQNEVYRNILKVFKWRIAASSRSAAVTFHFRCCCSAASSLLFFLVRSFLLFKTNTSPSHEAPAASCCSVV